GRDCSRKASPSCSTIAGRIGRRMTIARLGELTVEAARRKAAELKVQVRAGADPLSEIRAKRKEAERGITLATVIERWISASRSGWSGDTARTYTNECRPGRCGGSGPP